MAPHRHAWSALSCTHTLTHSYSQRSGLALLSVLTESWWRAFSLSLTQLWPLFLIKQNVTDLSRARLFCSSRLCGVCIHARGVGCRRGLLRLGRQRPEKLTGLPNRRAKPDCSARLLISDCQLHVSYHSAVQPCWGKSGHFLKSFFNTFKVYVM